MSQHIFEAEYKDKKVEVILGWDKPLQRYFMVIEYHEDVDLPEDDESEGIVYSNLSDPKVEHTLLYFQNKILELGIKTPDKIWTEVQKDEINNVGNKQVHYN